MQAIFALQGLVGAIYFTTAAAVAFRMLRLARRTRAIPELLLGAGLILGGMLGGPLEAAGMSVRTELGPAVAAPLLLVGKILALAGIVCHSCFIWRVFRPRAKWAAVLAGFIIAVGVAGLVGHAVNGAFVTAEIPIVWFCADLAGRAGVSAWLVFEGAAYYRSMKRRLALGLADPVVTNRFLLWSFSGAFTIVMLLTSVPPFFLNPRENVLVITADLMIFCLAGICISTLYFLTFFPPMAYRRRLEKRAEVAL
jgi:hypothetical protein